MKHSIIHILLTCGFSLTISAQTVERVEPLCWWADMKTELQLMFYGKDLKDATVKVLQQGIGIKNVHNAESANYLFVDVTVEKAGSYTFEISKGSKKTKVNYDIYNRRAGSASRVGLTSADVIYLIMPDRFANGDKGNDIIPGTKQVYDRGGLETRHGGDIQGIINHLDYMADLGITAIWPTPMLEDNEFYHHYAITDYYKIDPHFGTNQLYKTMVDEAHKKGLKVIQDVVPNHCGIAHWWMNDLPFKDWLNHFDIFTQSNYALQTYSDIHASDIDRKLCGKGWFIDILPDMNLGNPYVLKYLTQMAVWWIEYADLDAIRVDTYFYMGHEGSHWTKNIRNEYPDMEFVGEVWGNDPGVVSYWIGDKPKHDGFASHLPKAMDFPLERALIMGLSNDNEAWGGGTKAIYNVVAQDFLYDDAMNSLVIFADNHDTDRLYNMLGKDIGKVKMAMAIISTMRGIPQIYAGTELLFEDDTRGGPHKNRMDFPGGWEGDSINLFNAAERNALQQDIFNHLRKLLSFRKNTPVVYNGELMHYVPKDNVYTYFRYNESECVMVIVNGSQKNSEIDWNRFSERLYGKSKGYDVLSGRQISINENIKIEPRSTMILHFK